MYRGLFLSLAIFLPVRGYLAAKANESGERAGPLFDHTPQKHNNDPNGVYLGPFRMPFEFPQWWPGRV